MGFLNIIKEWLGGKSDNFFQQAQREFTRNVVLAVRRIERHFIKEIASAIILISAMIFLFIGFLFFLIDYLGLNRTISFLITSSVLLFVGILIKLIR